MSSHEKRTGCAKTTAELLALFTILISVILAAVITFPICAFWGISTEGFSGSAFKVFLECLSLCLVAATSVSRHVSESLAVHDLAADAARGGRAVTFVLGTAGIVLSLVAAADQWTGGRRSLAGLSVCLAVVLALQVVLKLKSGKRL